MFSFQLNTWSGSIEIGVTVCNPDVIDIPITATDLRGGTWVGIITMVSLGDDRVLS